MYSQVRKHKTHLFLLVIYRQTIPILVNVTKDSHVNAICPIQWRGEKSYSC